MSMFFGILYNNFSTKVGISSIWNMNPSKTSMREIIKKSLKVHIISYILIIKDLQTFYRFCPIASKQNIHCPQKKVIKVITLRCSIRNQFLRLEEWHRASLKAAESTRQGALKTERLDDSRGYLAGISNGSLGFIDSKFKLYCIKFQTSC